MRVTAECKETLTKYLQLAPPDTEDANKASAANKLCCDLGIESKQCLFVSENLWAQHSDNRHESKAVAIGQRYNFCQSVFQQRSLLSSMLLLCCRFGGC